MLSSINDFHLDVIEFKFGERYLGMKKDLIEIRLINGAYNVGSKKYKKCDYISLIDVKL
jgi:hypothetical protein